MIKICILALSLSFFCSLGAQNLRINHVWNRTSINFDINRLYNYNGYEHNRFGAGFNISTPLHYDNRYGTLFQNAFYAEAYAGCGTLDHAWKYGARAELQFPRNKVRKYYLDYHHDLERIGGHSFESYNILNTSANSTYFSSRYSMVDRIAAGMLIDFDGPSEVLLELRHSRERALFTESTLLYPTINEEDKMKSCDFNEINIVLWWGKHWTFNLLTALSSPSLTDGNDDTFIRADFFRLIAQYANKIQLSDNRGRLSLFAQGGTVLGDAPLSRIFDLGGTGGSRYYFYNTFLTVRPNSFMTDAFLLANIRYTTGRSLWNLAVSKPHPFVQLGAMWGILYGDSVTGNADTRLIAIDSQGFPTYLHVTQPGDGLLEPAIGIDGLLRWGMLDVGVAAAYQLTPKKSTYHLNNFLDNFAVMFTAQLIIDNK